MKNNHNCLLLLLLLCLLLSESVEYVHAQSISYETIAHPLPFAHSLYTNEMRNVYQDTEGYIWIATTSGLARWDGHRLITLRNDWRQSNLLTSNVIYNMADASGWMWIGTHSGLNCYCQHDGHLALPAEQRLHTLYINDVVADGKGGIWVAAGKRLFHWDGNKSLRTEEVNPFDGICSPQDPKALYADSHGRLWVVCYENMLIRIEKEGNRWKATRIPPIPDGGNPVCLYEDGNGHYWVGTWGQGLWQFLPDGEDSGECWKRHHFNTSEASMEDNCAYSMAEAHGMLWLLTYKRLHALRYEDGQLTDVNIDDLIPTNKMFTRIIRDREHNLWLPSYDEGYTIHFNTPDIRNYRLPTLSRLIQHDANLKGLLADGQRYVWLNQDRFGILLLDTETGDITSQTPEQGKEQSLLVKSHRPHSAWAGRRDGTVATLLTHEGLNVSMMEQVDVGTATDSAGALIAIYEDANEDLWLLTWNHLFMRKKGQSDIIVASNSEPFTAMTPCIDGKGVLCADGKHIFHCTENHSNIVCTQVGADFCSVGEEKVNMMASDENGSVWMVTSLGRIIRSDYSLKYFDTMPLTKQIVNEEPQDIRCIGNTIWLMTDKRLVAYDTRNSTMQTYTTGKDDICVQRFLLHALDIDSMCNVLAGGYGGFVRIQPSKYMSQPYSSNHPVVTDLLVNGQSVLFGAGKDEANTFKRITLSCNAHNIEIFLSTLIYGSVRPVAIQYSMDGVNDDWVSADLVNPSAFYNRLPRGSHSLSVRVQYADGEWSESFDILSIVRLPFWYETWWAFCIYSILMAVALYIIFLYVRARQKQRVHNEVTQAKMTMLSTSHPFADQLISIIYKHLSNSDFDVEQLAAAVNTSKSTLHRRLKGEVDMTPLELMNSIRMKRAGELLATDNSHTVAEIAYAVGFTSPKYFTQCFKSEYGTTPSEYRKRNSTKV